MQKAVGSTSCPMPSGSSPNTSCARWDSGICSTVSLSPLTRGAASRIPLFQILFDRYGLDFTTCLMTGNERTSDLAGAIAAGIDCCYLHTATSSGSADEPPKKARFTVMDGDSYALQKILLSLAR